MRHFIFQDEKSHKFWAVEQQGNELHINWGKVGTNGQSQVKSFADAAAAAKAELKLIAEKTKKGYVENASANVHIPPITKATPEVETSLESKNKRPWLADDAVIPVTDDINRFAFPHRSRPREINYLYKDGRITPGHMIPTTITALIQKTGSRLLLSYKFELRVINRQGVRNLMQHCSGAFGTLTLKMNWSMT